MNKKLDELNRKIRHSRKKHDGMVIEDLKNGSKPQTRPTPEPEWNFKGLERAFGGAYRSYRIGGCPRMDAETFFQRIREKLIEKLINQSRVDSS